MLTKLRAFASLYRELGPRWSAFRLAYAFRLRTGLIRLQMPQYKWTDRPLETWLKSDGGVGARSSRPILPIPKEYPPTISWKLRDAVGVADFLLDGMPVYFSRQFVRTGFPPNWHKDYFTTYVTLSDSEGSLLTQQTETLQSQQSLLQSDIDSTKHWSQISDDHVIARSALALPDEAISNDEETASAKTKTASQRHYDIKFIWEPNRFNFVYTLVRAYAATHNEEYPEAFWILIEDWAEHNPPNTGANWMDGQEIALRLMAWTFGYNAFLNSPSSTLQRKEQFTLYVAAQAERIYKNISYAISTRSNHAISEAFGLWLVGLLFPELKDSEKYLSIGRKLLEQEAANQILPDGSYSMYSINYHRFILHIYLYAIRLSEIYQLPFTNQLRTSVTNSIEYLSYLINPQTGEMPVYGSNDGALILPLNNCDFTDYRPLLQLGWYITQKEFLFEPGPWDEDIFWLCRETPTAKNAKKDLNLSTLSEPIAPLPGSGESFPNGGVYLLHNTNSQAILRCTDFRARPSHADQLHMDLWIHGHNIAVDAGTYLYSGEGIWRNGLAHTAVHNTVIVDNKDQMTMVSRFTWTNWSKAKVLKHDKSLWQGKHDGYKPVSHKRTVMALEDDRWLVVDDLAAREPHHYALHWLLSDFSFEQKENFVLLSMNGMKYKVQVGMTEGKGNFSIVRADPNSTRGWRSRYYGHKEPALSVRLEAHQSQVTFWTFFGFENDVLEIEGNALKINSKTIVIARSP
jgi:heparinase II/III-like protein